MGSDGVRDPHGRIFTFGFGAQGPVPETEKESVFVDSEVKKEKNGKKRLGRWSKKRMIGTQYRKWKRVCP